MLRYISALPVLLSAAFAQPSGVTPSVCPAGIASIADCPVGGCGGVSDSLLDVAKNRTDAPSGALAPLTVAQMTNLTQPASWLTGKDRSSLQGSGQEGTPVQLMAFLIKVKPEGKESCNCGLGKRADTDIHLVMVTNKNGQEAQSISGEITPRVRLGGHPDWNLKNVKTLQKKFVRLTGWLMLDTAHIPHTVLLTGERPRTGLNRASNWEVHPITRIEVCTSTVTKCRAGEGWQDF